MDIQQLKKQYRESKDPQISNQIRDYYQQYPASLSENVLLEYATGVGKSKAAMGCIKNNALIIHHRILHVDNWEEEIKKWGYNFNRDYLTYASLPKKKSIDHALAMNYDTVIVDECHHITEKTVEALKKICKGKRVILLSATVSYDKKRLLQEAVKFRAIAVTLKDAIQYGMLPSPIIHKVSVKLDNIDKNYHYMIKLDRTSDTHINCTFSNYRKYLTQRANLRVNCTQMEYLIMLNDQVDYLKKQYFGNKQEYAKLRWLRAATDRKEFLSYCKTKHVKEVLMKFKKNRNIIFCYDIKQSEVLSANPKLCINSKIGNYDIVEKFNNKEVNSIYAVGVLNEGMNIYDIDYGFIISLNGNEAANIQRLGRSFRSKAPEVFIFVVPNSRDEEYFNNLKEEIGDYVIDYN